MINFVTLIANKSKIEAQMQVAQLAQESNWEQPLISLVNAIEQYPDYEEIVTILKALPPEAVEVLFIRLFSSKTFNPKCLNLLIEYLIKDSLSPFSLMQHIFLAPIIPLSPRETQLLLSRIEPEKQKELLMSVYFLVKKNESQPKNEQSKSYQNTQITLHQLASTLYENGIISSEPTPHPSANVMMEQLLLAEQNNGRQKQLLLSIFNNNYHYYDWKDKGFLHFIRQKIIILAANLTNEELKACFKIYAVYGLPTEAEKVQFIDALYSANPNAQAITHCIDSACSTHPDFVASFLTLSKKSDGELRRHCLKRIPNDSLIPFCKHIASLACGEHYLKEDLISDYASELCHRINNTQGAPQLFRQLLEHIAKFHDHEKQIIISSLGKQLASPKLRCLWLIQNLIQTPVDKIKILPSCILLISQYPNEIELLLPIINQLSKEDLLALYQLMVAKKLPNTAFSCIRECFKNVSADRNIQEKLFYLIAGIPPHNSELLDAFINPLDDKTLLSLLDYLLSDDHYLTIPPITLQHILLVFCNRLYAHAEINADIHEWNNLPCAKRLAYSLLKYPFAVHKLTEQFTSGAFLSFVQLDNPEAELKQRIDAILNHSLLDKDEINHIALVWLDYFRADPQQLSFLFRRLISSAKNRTDTGIKNLEALHIECSKILNLGDRGGIKLLIKVLEAPDPNRFAPLMAHLSKDDYLKKAPSLGATQLAVAKESVPKEIAHEALISLLAQSIQRNTAINWTKTADWCKAQPIKQQLVFIKELMDSLCLTEKNPHLIEQLYNFITKYPSFKNLLPSLTKQQYYWLIKNSPQDQVARNASEWLDIIITAKDFHTIDWKEIFSLLPSNERFITLLLEKTNFNRPDTCAHLFIQLSLEKDRAFPIFYMRPFLQKQDPQWVIQFLKITLNSDKVAKFNTAAFYPLNALMLKLSATLEENKTIVILYIKLLDRLINQTDNIKILDRLNNQTEINNQSTELKSLLFRFLAAFLRPNSPWNELILSHEAFTKMSMFWLKNTDFNSLNPNINDNILLHICLNYPCQHFDTGIKSHHLFQQLLLYVLEQARQILNNEQFIHLFNLLSPDNKSLLATTILTKPCTVNELALLNPLVNYLEPLELFNLLEANHNPELIAQGLFFHSKGLSTLSDVQKTQLFDRITSTQQLMALLNNLPSAAIGFSLIDELFKIYGEDKETLSKKLEQWHITPEGLVALTNFVSDTHQQPLEDIIQETPYYQDFINNYLSETTAEFVLNENNYLYQIVLQNLLEPTPGKPFCSQLIKQLTHDDATSVIKKHFVSDQEKQFADLFNAYLQKTELAENDELNTWIIQVILFSPSSSSLDASTLKEYISSIKISKLNTLIRSFSEQLQHCKTICELEHQAFMDELLAKELTELSEIKTIAKLLNLTVLEEFINLTLQSKQNGADKAPEPDEDLDTELALLNDSLKQAALHLEQLVSLGFSYHPDQNNELRIINLSQEYPTYLPINILIQCLNSYSPVFAAPDFNPDAFFSPFIALLIKTNQIKEAIPQLDVPITNQLISIAIKDPIQYADLLEQFIGSNNVQKCVTELKKELESLTEPYRKADPVEDESVDSENGQLNASELEQIPPEELGKILSIQRLLFFAKPNPEFNSLLRGADAQETVEARQGFCADASLYMMLFNLGVAAKQPMTQCNALLQQICHNKAQLYANLIDKLSINFPSVHYYWMCWKGFILQNKTSITNELLVYLQKTDIKKLNATSNLHRLLEHIHELKLIPELLKSPHCKTLNASQKNWLCEHSIKITPTDPAVLSLIINICPYEWLDDYLRDNSRGIYELLMAAMKSEGYLSRINENKSTQFDFFTIIRNKKLDSARLLQLIKTAPNQQTQSLFILCLLSDEHSLNSFKGGSIINQLNSMQHSPSRLSSLVNQLDPHLLTEQIINIMPQEVCASILCSVTHFHQLTNKQVERLVNRISDPRIISYWINHYSTMPNAHFILAKLIKLNTKSLKQVFDSLEEDKKEHIVTSIIQHIELFSPSLAILSEKNEEKNLILALNFLLKGNNHQSYKDYINKLLDKLIAANHPFSLPSLQLLISLRNHPEYTDINNKMAHLINHYLRECAENGTAELFYTLRGINNECMSPVLELSPEIYKPNAGKPNPQNTPQQRPAYEEHSLIQQFKNNKQKLSALNYYLIHCKDHTEVSELINDHLSYHVQAGCRTEERNLLYQTAQLINLPIAPSIKTAIHTSFLHYPELHDETICSLLFKYDAKSAIQHYGLKGGEKNYIQVIDMCHSALKKLEPETDAAAIEVANKALAEAELELEFSKDQGFFSRLMNHLKRCWILGWTGFFSPNPPLYVAPSTTAELIEPRPPMPFHKAEPDLPSMLKEIPSPLTKEYLDELMEAFDIFSFKAKTDEQWDTRVALEHIFNQLSDDAAMGTWVTTNQNYIQANHFALLEMSLKAGHLDAELLEHISTISPALKPIIEELTPHQPEIQNRIMVPLQPPLPTPTKVVSEAVSKLWSTATGGISSLLFTTPATVAQSTGLACVRETDKLRM